MQLAYLDESETLGYFTYAAAIVDERSIQAIDKDLADVASGLPHTPGARSMTMGGSQHECRSSGARPGSPTRRPTR